MKEKALVVTIISFLLLVVSITTAIYAWFGLVEKTPKILITSGSVELHAHLYENSIDVGNEITEAIKYTKVVPGDVYEFVLTVKNDGTITSKLDVVFNLNSSSNLSDYIIFTITDDQTPAHSGSVDFSENEYLYENTLSFEEVITISFSITISGDLELTHLSSNDVIEITSIEITLEQIL